MAKDNDPSPKPKPMGVYARLKSAIGMYGSKPTHGTYEAHKHMAAGNGPVHKTKNS